MKQDLTITCLYLCKWAQYLQNLDEDYKKYNIPKPFDDLKINPLNLLYGVMKYPRNPNKNRLKSAFITMLERNFCRSNYEGRIEILEKILSDAVPKYGTQKIIDCTDKLRPGFAKMGHIFVLELEKAGFRLQNPELLGEIITLAQNRAKETIMVDEPVWMAHLKFDSGIYPNPPFL